MPLDPSKLADLRLFLPDHTPSPRNSEDPGCVLIYVHAGTQRSRSQHLTINAQNSNEQLHVVNHEANIKRKYAEISLTIQH